MSTENRKIETLEAEVVNTELTIEERFLNQSLAKVDVVEVELREVSERYSKLVEKPIETAEEYKLVYDAHQDVKSRRMAIASKETEIKRKIDKVKKDFVSGVAVYYDFLAVEKDLEASRKVWEKKEEDRKNAEKLEKERIKNERIELTKNAGALFDGEYYTCGTVSVSLYDIEKMADNRFEKLIESIVEQKQMIDDLLAKKAEEDRIKAEQEAKEKAEAEERQKQQEEENKRMKEQLMEMRVMMLNAHGLTENNGDYSYLGCFITSKSTIETLSDPEFMNLNSSIINRKAEIEKEISDKKEAEELKAKQNEVRNKNVTSLTDLGFIYDGQRNVLVYKTQEGEINVNEAQFLNDYNELDKEYLNNINVEINALKEKTRLAIIAEQEEAKKIEEAAKAKAESERISKLNDEELYNEYLSKLKKVEVPNVTTPEFMNKVEIITNILNR